MTASDKRHKNSTWINGHTLFEQGATEEVDRLLIHEFGHQYSTDHLSEDYHEALCGLGARMKRLALDQPEAVGRFLSPPNP